MPLSIACPGCGKTLKIRDELIAKRIKCPGCGLGFTAAEAAAKLREKQSGASAGKGIHVSPKVILFVAILILIPGILATWKFGPGKIIAEWNQMKPHAEDNVRDVVDRALQAHLSQTGEFNPMLQHMTPHTLDVTFLISPMPWSMPATVGFAGTTTQGAIVGHYSPRTGEVEVKVEIGGRAVPGKLIKHGETMLNVTGQVKDGNVTSNIDGKPAEVKWPTPGKRYL